LYLDHNFLDDTNSPMPATPPVPATFLDQLKV
jgi:hypothetical protein